MHSRGKLYFSPDVQTGRERHGIAVRFQITIADILVHTVNVNGQRVGAGRVVDRRKVEHGLAGSSCLHFFLHRVVNEIGVDADDVVVGADQAACRCLDDKLIDQTVGQPDFSARHAASTVQDNRVAVRLDT